ncbi:MAG: TonB-dependent receptor [Cytophagales bacterium]|nr:TonB-dependent receptor [Cytophagales bacterium]
MNRPLGAFYVFFVLITFFLFDTKGQGNATVYLDQRSYTVEALVLELDRQLASTLVYSLDKLPKITIELKKSSYSQREILKVLKRKGVASLVRNDRILLTSIDLPVKKKSFTLSGYVRDAQTGEALISANVFTTDNKHGVITNRYGYYSMTLPEGEYEIHATFIGLDTPPNSIHLTKNKTHHFRMSESVAELEEVVISSRPPSFNINGIIPGINAIDFTTDNHIPYFMGEVDVFQGSLLLPGIKTLGEEAAGINVRGGNIDENLILLDEAPIYNPTHFFGLISVFNPEAVNDIQFLKGFFPAQYGGRASSVINVHQKEGNDQEFHFAGGLGLLSARLLAEGPIKRGQSSFLISGRQSIIDPTELGPDNVNRNSNTSFGDLNIKMNWKLNDRNTFYVSSYLGRDRNRTSFDSRRDWGNSTLTLRWNKQFAKRIFGHFSGVLSTYEYTIEDPREAGSFRGQFRVTDYSLKADFSYFVSPTSQFDFGATTTFHRLSPGTRTPFDPDDSSTNPLELDSEHGFESGIYLSHQWQVLPNLEILYGARFSSMHNISLGDSEIYRYIPGGPKRDDTIADTVRLGNWELVRDFFNLEPRASLNWRITNNTAVKAAYNRTYQYIHLISNTITPSPTDIWKLSDRNIEPTQTDHFSLGYYRNFADNSWESSLELFHKEQRNIIDYKDGADLLFNPNPETEFLNARGRAYGLEFFLKKNTGKTRGWASYTLSRAERRVKSDLIEETINDGAFFPDNNDKTHDFSMVILHQHSPRLSFSSTFNYSTGRPITLPTGKYTFEGNPIPHFAGRNQDRLSDYHRLDLSARLEGKKVRPDGRTRKFADSWTLTLYNVYARRNAFSYIFRENPDITGQTQVVRYSVLGFIFPSLTYNFKF